MDEFWNVVQAQQAAFARWQSSALGKSRGWLDTHVRHGEFEVMTQRVLRLTGAPRTAEQDLMIAVLDAGPGSVATMRSAAWLWSVPGFSPGALDVIRGRGQERREGATSRWPRRVPAHHVTMVRGIPVVTLARTIFELASMPLYVARFPRIIDTIDGKSPALLVALHEMLPEVAGRGKSGSTFMRETLAYRPADRVRLTGVERRFEHILTEAGIPVPRRQVDIGGHSWIGRVDYLDDDIAVIYEIDSAAHHASFLDRLHDERRDAEARAAGFREIVRITDEGVWYDPPAVRGAVLDARRRHRRAA